MKYLSLDGNWRLKIPERKRPLQASVPGCIHTDLMVSGLLKNPLYRDNIVAGRVSATGPATYEREFNLNPIPENERIFLRFDGLDTLAAVIVNDHIVGHADNMFHVWRFEITQYVKAGRNKLTVEFASVLPLIKEKQANKPLECSIRNGELEGRTYVRKRKIDFGSDYSPSIPSLGIWRSVYVEFSNCARIISVTHRQIHTADAIAVEATAAAEVYGPVENLNFYGRVLYRGIIMAETVARPNEKGQATLHLDVRNAQRWWPNGMGEQPLYELQIELIDGHRQLDYFSRRIGLRTYRIERDKDNFKLFVNDVPMFIRGANWTTPDIFVSRPTRVEYARLVKAANVANMNMLRVTGDGIYEQEYFYDLCDEYGICVWQDFMMSDAAYPIDDPEFLKNIQNEAEITVARLSHHASLAIWCGGDRLLSHVETCDSKVGELASSRVSESVSEQNPQNTTDTNSQTRKLANSQTGKMPQASYEDFVLRFLPDCIKRLSPGTQYIQDSSGPDYIDQVETIYNDKRAFSHSPAPLYTGFGFPSLPDERRFDAVFLPEDKNLNSEVFKAHITRESGIKPVNELMLSFFKLPCDFRSYTALSQILQGITAKTLVEHWRRLGDHFGGSLFTRLNDSWPALSEASLDSEGHWKCLHYFARRFYGNLLVTGVPNPKTGTADVFVHNNSPAAFTGKIKWTILDTTGHIWREMEKPIDVKQGTVVRLGTLKLTDLLQKVGPDKLLVWLRLIADDGYSPSSDCLRFVRPKNLALEDPHITTEIRQWDDHCYAVTLNVEKPAMWCWIDFDPCAAKFDENFFCIAPGQSVRVRVTPVDHFKLNDFKKGLKIRSLYDTFKHS